MEHQSSLLAAVLLLLSLQNGVLLLATPRDGGTLQDGNNPVSSRQTEEDPSGNCPGYIRGSPNSRDKEGCTTGSAVGPLDHVRAFGFRGSDLDMRLCALPEYPEMK